MTDQLISATASTAEPQGTRLPKSLWIGAVVLALLMNAAILFVGFPAVSSRMDHFYNQEEYVDGYDQLALNLMQGHGYRMYPDTAPTMSREPGYPVLLAGLFLLFGTGFTVVKVTNFVFAFATAGLLIWLVRRVFHNHPLALIAPLLFLFHPGILVAESRGGTEIVFAFFLTLFLCALYRAMESNRYRDYVLAGLALGLTVLVRSVPMLFPFFLLAYFAVMAPKGTKINAFGRVAALMLAMLVTLSPWIIRNYQLSGKFIPTASVMGISAHAGQYDNTHLGSDNNWAAADRAGAAERKKIALELGYPFKDVTNAYYQDFYSTGDEVKFSSALMERVIAGYRKDPLLYAHVVGANLFNLWFRGKTQGSTLMNMVVQLPYLILAACGIILCLKNGRGKAIAPLGLFLLYSVGLYVAILAQARYSVPLMPFLSIFAGIAVLAGLRYAAAKFGFGATILARPWPLFPSTDHSA
jgi:4-amino-4-deoxy-L-arabinose transferase-like glycosyltransferase